MARWKNNDGQEGIGGTFLTFAPFFKLYSQYVNNHPLAADLLDQLLQIQDKKNKFLQFLEKAEKNPRCNNGNLAFFLIMVRFSFCRRMLPTFLFSNFFCLFFF